MMGKNDGGIMGAIRNRSNNFEPSESNLTLDGFNEFIENVFHQKPIFYPGQTVMYYGEIMKIKEVSDSGLIFRNLYFYERFYSWLFRICHFKRIRCWYLTLIAKFGLGDFAK